MKQYRLDPAALPRRRRIASIMVASVIVVAGSIGVGLPWYLNPQTSDVTPRLWGIAILGLVMLFVLWKVRRQLNNRWQTFAVSCGTDELVLTDPLVGERRVARVAVREVSRIPGKGIVVHSADEPPLFVPELLVDFGELEAVLGAWAPGTEVGAGNGSLEEIRRKRDRRVSSALWFVLACWITVGFAPVGVVPLLGLLMLGCVVYIFRSFEKLGVPKRFARSLKFGLILMLLGPPARLWLEHMKNTGWGSGAASGDEPSDMSAR